MNFSSYQFQFIPTGIVLLNQFKLPLPSPTLQSFLKRNRILNAFERLAPNQTVNLVLGRVATEQTVLVFVNPASKIVGYTYI